MKVLIFANVGLNLIDGSTVWVQSLSEVLASLPEVERVVVLSRDRLEPDGFGQAISGISKVEVVEATDFDDPNRLKEPSGSQTSLLNTVMAVHRQEGFDRIIIRDINLALELVSHPEVARILWVYLLQSPTLEPSYINSQLQTIAAAAAGLLVQTDMQRSLLEGVIGEANPKVSILPPMIPRLGEKVARRDLGGPIRFIYAGKYSKSWNVESYFDLPETAASEGIDVEVTMAGDKVHHEPEDPKFRARILTKFASTPGVNWLGPLSREQSVASVAGHDLGLCFRESALNDSLEISTKFLEFASQAVPAVVNRTAAYEALLGADYPYFADAHTDIIRAARFVVSDPEGHERARDRVRSLASGFTFEAAASRLRETLRIRRPQAYVNNEYPKKVVVVAHDFKFINQALDVLGQDRRLSIRMDRWRSTKKHDASLSAEALGWADVVFAEWCAGPAVWYSQRKRDGQKLFVRLHRFEAFTDFPRLLNFEAVDALIVVSDHMRDYCVEKFGWDRRKMIVLPQYVDAGQFRRPKHPGAEFVLGLVGMNPFLKRPDRALEVLRQVRGVDKRYTLRIRSRMPWETPWVWNDPEEQEKFREFFSSLDESEYRGAVQFDRAGPDMAEWFRNVGFVLSTSDVEGCHTAVAEGLASGAKPIVWDWPGARSVYGSFVKGSTSEMAAAVVESGFDEEQHCGHKLAEMGRDRFDIGVTIDLLERLLLGAEVLNDDSRPEVGDR